VEWKEAFGIGNDTKLPGDTGFCATEGLSYKALRDNILYGFAQGVYIAGLELRGMFPNIMNLNLVMGTV
jgi:hypothetical protein